MGRDRYGEFDALVHDAETESVADRILAGKAFALTSGPRSGVPDEPVLGKSIQNRPAPPLVNVALIDEDQLLKAGEIVSKKGPLSLAPDWGTGGGVPEKAVMSQLAKSRSGYYPDVTQTTEEQRAAADTHLSGSPLKNAGLVEKAPADINPFSKLKL